MDNFEGFEADGNSVGNRILKAFANSLDPDETPQNMAREQLSVRLSDSNQEVIVYGREAVRKPDQCRPTRPPPTTHADRTRPLPDRLVGLDRVDLISSGNPA
ncbi:hypothetical protein DPMN_183701 [Dreissena polymorpha]|uniref:Uncharacterized protein n=1 Tax=Dreissena polymorpha TaxID=45954 RepID=A0A9D4DHV3_DREPO|nr:hypothetical protein DPMN_183701 [Dreissena polymorpha]